MVGTSALTSTMTTTPYKAGHSVPGYLGFAWRIDNADNSSLLPRMHAHRHTVSPNAILLILEDLGSVKMNIIGDEPGRCCELDVLQPILWVMRANCLVRVAHPFTGSYATESDPAAGPEVEV